MPDEKTRRLSELSTESPLTSGPSRPLSSPRCTEPTRRREEKEPCPISGLSTFQTSAGGLGHLARRTVAQRAPTLSPRCHSRAPSNDGLSRKSSLRMT